MGQRGLLLIVVVIGALLVTTSSAFAWQAETNAASEVETTQATANGTLQLDDNEGDTNVIYSFQYGTTTSYELGHSSEQAFTVGTVAGCAQCSATGVGASLTALTPSTTYHFRIVARATYPDGITVTQTGSDQTFTTAPAPVVPPSDGGSGQGGLDPGTGPGDGAGNDGSGTDPTETLPPDPPTLTLTTPHTNARAHCEPVYLRRCAPRIPFNAWKHLSGKVVSSSNASQLVSVERQGVRLDGKHCRALVGRSWRKQSCQVAGRRWQRASLRLNPSRRSGPWSAAFPGLHCGHYRLKVRVTERESNGSLRRETMMLTLDWPSMAGGRWELRWS
jgi:hypothetical protein